MLKKKLKKPVEEEVFATILKGPITFCRNKYFSYDLSLVDDNHGGLVFSLVSLDNEKIEMLYDVSLDDENSVIAKKLLKVFVYINPSDVKIGSAKIMLVNEDNEVRYVIYNCQKRAKLRCNDVEHDTPCDEYFREPFGIDPETFDYSDYDI